MKRWQLFLISLGIVLCPSGSAFARSLAQEPAPTPDPQQSFPTTPASRANDPGHGTLRAKAASPERPAESSRASLASAASARVLSAGPIQKALSDYRRRFDAEHGGVRGARKSPALLPVPLLLRGYRRTHDPELLRMATQTLDAMSRGGLYDHLGGGFHQYAVEPSWTVPHFGKLLYDNALLAITYLEAYQATHLERYANVVRDILAYLGREMTAPEGTFYAASHADSGEKERRYYLWTPEQIRAAVGPELAPLALAAYGMRPEGHFRGGRSVLRRDLDAEALAKRLGSTRIQVEHDLLRIRKRLREARDRRGRPSVDRRQIVGWNGLAIAAFARAGLAQDDPSLVAAARRAAAPLLDRARPQGTLARYLLRGAPHETGLLDDHAYLIAGLLDLFEATSEIRWVDAAVALQHELDERFLDPVRGGYYLSPSDGAPPLAREKPGRDGALPSGNSVAALNLLRLNLLTSDAPYRSRAERTIRAFSETLDHEPAALNRMLDAVDFMTDAAREILIVTPRSREEARPFLRELARVFLPNRVLLTVPEGEIPQLQSRFPLLRYKRALGGRTTAYVCENGACELPARDPTHFARQIRTPPEGYPSGPARPRPAPGHGR